MGKRGRRKKREAAAGSDNFSRSLGLTAAVTMEIVSGADPAEMIAERREEVRKILGDFDAVHVISFALMAESPLDANTYAESEHEGLAFVVEMIAAEALDRPSRESAVTVSPVLDKSVMDRLRQLVREATVAESIRRRGPVSEPLTAERRARDRAAMHHLMVRNPGWAWQEEHVLRELFGDEGTSAKLIDRFGFNAEDAVRCAFAMAKWPPQQIQKHMAASYVPPEDFNEKHPAMIWAKERADIPDGFTDTREGVGIIVMMWASQFLGDALMIDATELAELADVSESAAAAFLSTFSLPFGETNPDWFAAAEQVRWKPFVRAEAGNYIVTSVDNVLWGIRREFEAAVSDDTKFLKHRGDWVEAEAKRMLERALHPDESFSSVDYKYIGDDGTEVVGEIDVLLRVGDVAVICEAKSARMKDGALRGGQALIDFMKQNITKAARQTGGAREAIRQPGGLTVDGKPLVLGEEIREVHPIVVTLSDLSAIAPVIWEFNESLTMPADVTIPWVVTLNELDSITQTVEWPAQLVHYMRRRTRLNERAFLAATDELDWWMHYLLHGLYFEDDEEADRVFVTSLTDPLDAWMMFEHGQRSAPAPKPQQKLDPQTRAMLDELTTDDAVGRISAACTLLEMDERSRRKFWQSLKKLRGLAKTRGRTQRFAMVFEDGVEPMMVLGLAVPPSQAEHISDLLEMHVAERVEELGFQRTLAVGVVSTSPAPFDAIGTLERDQLASAQSGDYSHAEAPQNRRASHSSKRVDSLA